MQKSISTPEMELAINRSALTILLADDDSDDCVLFEEALNETAKPAHLTIVRDGVQLMQQLEENELALPDVVFLDLNMPRKNGFACLAEIKQNEKLAQLDVIIISTSFHQEVVDRLYKNGARLFIRKPTNFHDLKKIINEALAVIKVQSPLENLR